ncbi:hypothetical protein [Phenylobacterium sp.]|uniref:hypothetical protein n=1 Tax=Phenylobacterium sp. TaxID=1871053 RepID=UPI00272FB9F9|nr:hypothetical protein [Phenylobacterium sp.]MDP2214982.1 hypothetical protein [Phenylobacterium sp.]
MNENEPDPKPQRTPVRMVRIIGEISANAFKPADVVQIVPIPLELLERGRQDD